MRIVCSTTYAAAEVIALLLEAALMPAHDFVIDTIYKPLPLVTLTPCESLPDALLNQIAAVPETQIVS